MSKVWFITGANRGFGREFALAALGRGDKVVATSRRSDALTDLVRKYGDHILPIQLDVTQRAAVFAAVQAAQQHFGVLDVVVNNAGYGLFGTVEELSEAQLRAQMEVNFFGLFHVTQAALPVLRSQGHGHIIQISTVGGVTTFPTLGGYHASKWAVEGLSETLAQEVAPFGIEVTLVEPGGFATDWSGSSAVHATRLPAYDELRKASYERASKMPPQFTGDPRAAGPALLKIVDASEPPLRVFFGEMPLHIIPGVYAQRLKTWEQWADLSKEANGHQGRASATR